MSSTATSYGLAGHYWHCTDATSNGGDMDDQRDYQEEAYWRDFCQACGTSPCSGMPGDDDHGQYDPSNPQAVYDALTDEPGRPMVYAMFDAASLAILTPSDVASVTRLMPPHIADEFRLAHASALAKFREQV